MPLPAIIAGLAGSGVLAGAGGFLSNLFGQERQHSKNMEIARFQAEANERYLDKYNEYNTPANQMKRFQEAGLNPHLVYGQGSPGNQSQPLSYPDIQKTDYQQAFSQIVPLINQTKMVESQTQALDAKTVQTTVLTELNKLQKEVLAKNPLLNDEGFKATIDSLKSAAAIKASESTILGNRAEWETTEGFGKYGASKNLGQEKMWRELEMIEQRFKLSSLDAQLKAEVLTSKEFQNIISEIQVRWLRDADITPQHFYNLIQLILSKSF